MLRGAEVREFNYNSSVVAPCDYDRDGDIDLFVGGRSVPMRYGPRPRSYVYANDGKGHYTDVTEQLNRELLQVGMVTGAVWVDVTGDGIEELVVVGEWMYPHIYRYGKGKLEELKGTGLEELQGWWQTVSAGDVTSTNYSKFNFIVCYNHLPNFCT